MTFSVDQMTKHSINLWSIRINTPQNREQSVLRLLCGFLFFFFRSNRLKLLSQVIPYSISYSYCHSPCMKPQDLILCDILLTHQLCPAREDDQENFCSFWVLMEQFAATELLIDKLNSFSLLDTSHLFRHPLSHVHTCKHSRLWIQVYYLPPIFLKYESTACLI